MIDLTPEARKRFEDYLQRTRNALRGTRAVEAAEVELNVIEHVELALAGVPGPVGPEPLQTVLEQLGPPERWLPDEETPLWRRILGRLSVGPEDWRLTYLAFGVTVLMILTFPVGGVILLPVAFFLSRATVELIESRGEDLGARRWLVLPPIWMVLLILTGALLMVGVAAPMVFASEQGVRELGFEPQDRLERLRISAGFVALVAGAWYVVLSGLLAWLLPAIRTFFAPVVNRVRRDHLLVLTAIGAVAMATGAALIWAI